MEENGAAPASDRIDAGVSSVCERGELREVVTEILGALIVLGAVLVLIMRRLLGKGKGKEQESVEVSASRLRYEIERSGDAVIGRMQIHVERLERLLAEANAQKAALDERLAALAQWEKAYGAQLGALPQQSPAQAAVPAVHRQAAKPAASSRTAAGFAAATAPVSSGREEAPSFEATLMKQMAGTAVGGSVDLALPPEEMAPRAPRTSSYNAEPTHDRVEPPRYEVPEASPASSLEASDVYEDEEEEYDGFEEEEYEDEAYEEAPDEDELLSDEGAEEEALSEDEDEIASSEEEDDPETEPVEPAAPSAVQNRQQEQIRAFLRQGLSVEEISQRLGLGLGAIELIRHMERRTREAKDDKAMEE